MQRAEARTVAEHVLEGISREPFDSLVVHYLTPQRVGARGPSGTSFVVELTAHWDDYACQTLRLTASVDDGGIVASLAPVSVDLVVTRPQGH